MRKCEVEGCDNKHLARGMCMKHHGRWRRHGDTNSRLGFTYAAAHLSLREQYGRAKEHDCSVCFQPADEWAFVKEWCPEEEMLSQIRGKKSREFFYSKDAGHYITLCRSHHRSYDAGISPSWELSNE